MNEHEQAFIASFVSSARRERYFHLLSSAKQRTKFRFRMAHALARDLDARYLYVEDQLPPDVSDLIRRLLKQVGGLNAQCYIMCENIPLDGQEATIAGAERQWDSLSAIIISVVPGALAYYRPERPNKNYVLWRET
jgi:hypothetical protein